MNKKPYVIACSVLAVDMRHSAGKLGLDIEYKFLEAGLHNNPRLLKENSRQPLMKLVLLACVKEL